MTISAARAYLRICAKRPNFNLPGSHGPMRIDDYSQERLLILLISHLCVAVDARQPTAISGMAVVPAGQGKRPKSTVTSRRCEVACVLGVDASHTSHKCSPFDRRPFEHRRTGPCTRLPQQQHSRAFQFHRQEAQTNPSQQKCHP